MKKLIIVAAIALSSLGAIAQKGLDKSPEQKAQKTSIFLQRKLALTEEQKTSVYQATLDRISKMQDLRAQNLEKTALLQQSKPIRDDFNNAMKTTLTPEQFAKWENLKAEKKNKAFQNRGKKGKQKKLEEKTDSLGDID